MKFTKKLINKLTNRINLLTHSIANIGFQTSLATNLNDKVRITNFVSFIFGWIVVSYSIFFAFLKLHFYSVMLLPFAFIYFSVLAINWFKFYLLARVVTLANFISIVYVFSTALGRQSGVHFWMLPVMLTPLLLFKLEEKKYLIPAMIVPSVVFIFLVLSNFRYPIFDTPNISSYLTPTLVISMLVGSLGLTQGIILFLMNQYEAVLKEKILNERQLTDTLAMLRKSEDRFRVLFENSPLPTLFFDSEGIVDCNKATVKILNAKNKAELKSKHPAYFSPEFQPDGKSSKSKSDEMDSIARNAGFHQFIWTHRTIDGTNFPVEVTLAPITIDSKNALFVVWRDISKEESLKKDLTISSRTLDSQTKLLTQIINNATIKIFLVDRNATFQLVNTLVAKDFNLSIQELIGKSVYDVFPKAFADTLLKETQEVIDTGVATRVERYFPFGDTYRYEWIYRFPVYLNNSLKPTHMGGIVTDLTELKKLEHQLVAAAKMSSLGEMAGGIAHEINNPVGIIQGKAKQLLKIIQSKNWDNQKGEVQLQKIVFETDRIARIVRGLQAFSRNGDKDPCTLVKIKSILDDLLDLSSERFKYHRAKLEIVPMQDIEFECRAVQITQVLSNLLSNALDAISSLKEKWVRIDVKKIENKVRIVVTDSGNGIPPHIAEKLMNPFFTTKDVNKGTGLGLSISKGIIEDHGGKLWLDSESKNTSFVIELPVSQKTRSDVAA